MKLPWFQDPFQFLPHQYILIPQVPGASAFLQGRALPGKQEARTGRGECHELLVYSQPGSCGLILLARVVVLETGPFLNVFSTFIQQQCLQPVFTLQKWKCVKKVEPHSHLLTPLMKPVQMD